MQIFNDVLFPFDLLNFFEKIITGLNINRVNQEKRNRWSCYHQLILNRRIELVHRLQRPQVASRVVLSKILQFRSTYWLKIKEAIFREKTG